MSQLEADQTFAIWQKSSLQLAELERCLRATPMANNPEATALSEEIQALRAWTQHLYERAASAHRENKIRFTQKRKRH